MSSISDTDIYNLLDIDSDIECVEDDDVFCETEDSESQPLYPGAAVSLGAIMLLLALFCTKHNLAGDGIQQLLNIFAIVLPNGNIMSTTLHEFKKFFRSLKTPIVKHFYCEHCLGFLGDENNCNDVCPFSTCGKPLKQNKEYFLEMPVESQLQSLFSQEDFYTSIQYRFTRTQKVTLSDIYDGNLYKQYYENGGPLSFQENISFTFNTDGASVFKSSNVSVWPIFLVINELPYKLRMKKENMILAGLWFGNKKPFMGTFLQPFLQKFKKFEQGINITCKERGQFLCRAFLLCGTSDLPARCLLCNSVQFNGSYSCWKCLQKGETAKVGKGHCHVFPFQEEDPKNPERTKESVVHDARKALDKLESGVKQYSVNGIKGPSWLSFFPRFDIVQGIGIDYMHGVLLGIQKLMITLWFSSTHKGKHFSFFNSVFEADRRLLSICPTLNISRLPRSINNDLKYWKASEFRSFLLFYGAPILNGILDANRFQHFLLLVNALHILLKSGCTETELVSAELMLAEFVRDFPHLYDRCFMTLNMHQLLHLVDDVRQLGPLFTHSCFPFEDKNGVLLKMIRGTQNIDTQIITGVSFLQKLPELKLKTIKKGTDLEKLYNSIEHPTLLTRGMKITDNIYVLGSVKTRVLTNEEHAAVCDFVGFDPVLNESIRYFKRLEFNDNLIYGTTYSRMKKRDNSAICYKLDNILDQSTELFGRVKDFLILDVYDNLYENVFAVVKKLNCKQYSPSCILAVKESEKLTAVPLASIIESCVFVSYTTTGNLKRSFVCRFPNTFESD
ncbi:uncharacterized protein LOC128559474 [Mercenaria mercenaria]|uniref:uncharacterized protein LOC128559474 n=1 Tax=Mercenaria mercenaria TaxID=6596 RepID=UPI00234F6D72|nr:uncharacterized protein LOC128559474 [Mercenaria mercenaria]